MKATISILAAMALCAPVAHGATAILSGVGFEITLPEGYSIESQRDYKHAMSGLQARAPDGTYLGLTAGFLSDFVHASVFYAAPPDGAKEEELDGWKIYTEMSESNDNKKLAGVHARRRFGEVGFGVVILASVDRDPATVKKELRKCLGSIKPSRAP